MNSARKIAQLLSVFVLLVAPPLELSASAQPPATGAAALTPEFRAAVAAEQGAILGAAQLTTARTQAKRSSEVLDGVRARVAAKLKRALTPQEQAVIQNLYSMALVQSSMKAAAPAMAASPIQAMLQGPPADVTRELEKERDAIAAAGKKNFKDAAAPTREITARIAARTGRSADDPALYTWVMQAVQAVRVMAAYAPGGAVYNALPAAFKPALDGTIARDLIAVFKVDELAAAGKVDEAVDILRRSFAQTDAIMSPIFTAGTAAAGAQMASAVDIQLDMAQRVASKAPTHARAVETGFATAALRKAKGLETERRISAGLAGSSDASVYKTHQAWRASRTAIAQLEFQRAYGLSSTPEQEQQLAQLTALESRLEGALAASSKNARSGDAAYDIDSVVPALRRALAPGERLLSYVRFGAQAGVGATAQYAAYVLDAQKLTFVDLGPATAIDDAVNAYVDALNRLGSDSASIQKKQALARALHALCFAPVEPSLAGASAVRVAADGALQLVPFAALHDGKDWLLNRYPISYLSSERDALGSRAARAPAPPLVVTWSPPLADPPKPDPSSGTPLKPEDFRALPGVSREAQFIAALLPKGRVLDGSSASDWTLQNLSAPSILHVAAHGVFIDGGQQSGAGRGIALAPIAGDKNKPASAVAPDATATPAIDPLVRSALVLGSNASPSTDGFLTAYEVAAMNMSGTELTVLSACETGRGGPTRLNGVRGLRAAFFAAGAQSLVVSLWSVRTDPDVKKDPTVNLMQDFYASLAKRQGRRDALQSAMLAARARNPDPSTWAPFILLGATGPLVTFGATAPLTASVADESAQARVGRMAEFRKLENARANGSGEWHIDGAKDSLVDYEVHGGLGPQGDNVKINLVGPHTLIAFFVEGYSPGRPYRRVQAGFRVKKPSEDVDAASLDLGGNQLTPVRDVKLKLTGGGGTPLSGTFSWRFGNEELTGNFQVPGDF